MAGLGRPREPTRRLIAVGLLLAAVAGCSGEQVPVLKADPAAAIALGARGPADFRYVCLEAPFDAAVLLAPGADELADTPDAKALRKYLATPPAKADNLPASGWHLLGRQGNSAEYATFVEHGPDAPTVRAITVEEGWRVRGAGWCAPKLVLPAAVGIATWTLDPDSPTPGPETQVIGVLVREQTCASGHGPDGRIVGPAVFWADDRVQILFGVRPLEGAQTCQGVPPGRVRADLGDPIGDRLLVDPAIWPPTVVDLGANARGG